MRRTILFLGLILFFLTSCKEDKAKNVSLDQETQVESEVELVGTLDGLQQEQEIDHSDVIGEYTADFELFTLTDLEGYLNRKVGFVSFSDIYPLSEHPDSLAVPILKKTNTDSLQHIVLDAKYRERFFNTTKISPKDSLFIYDYHNDTHLSFPIEKLDVVAILSPYSEIGEDQNDQYDYMIGFQIDNESLNLLGEDYATTFVSFGSQSPFERGKMKAIIWQEIDQKDFPSQIGHLQELEQLDLLDSRMVSQAYSFTTKDIKFYLMDYFLPQSSYDIQHRHLVLIDSKTGKLIRKELMDVSESKSIAPVTTNASEQKEDWGSQLQYTGVLLKNKPEVLFGFYWVSFGCEAVDYIPSIYNYIAVNCDNRH
ncbi:hypothetical protein ACYSNM_11210 [Myroides sp. LJL116]